MTALARSQRALRRLCYDGRQPPAAAPLGIYRTLVRNTLWETLEQALPATLAALGPGAELMFRRFLREAPPRERYLRHVPAGFVAYLALTALPRTAPAWTLDLARYEAACFDAEHAGWPDDDAPALGPARPDAPLCLHPSARVLRLGHRVHEAHGEAPARGSLALLVYRDAETDEACTLELAPRAAVLLERLAAGATLGAAIGESLWGASEPQAALAAAVGLLEELGRRRVALGARA